MIIESRTSAWPRLKPWRALGIRYGARVMFSVPPATTIASGSSSIARTPSTMAFIPLPQTMFTVVPLTLSGIPEKMTTWRAQFW